MAVKSHEVRLDELDHKILSALRHNSRLTIREIADRTRIRPSTVHLRIQRLISYKVIEKFTLKLNDKLIGQDFIVFMFVNSSRDLPPSFFNDSKIKDAFGVTGEYDLILKLKFKDISEFNEYVINLRNRKEIVKTLTTVVTINIKEEL